MTRRDSPERATAAGQAAGGGSLATPAAPERAGRDGAGDLPPDLGPRTVELLRLAARAPSSHNVQPWRVQVVGPNRLRVGLDPERRLPVVDPDGRELLLSLGCFLENLVQAGPAFGVAVEVAPGDGDLPVEVRLAETVPDRDRTVIGRIEMRRTVRKGYLPAPLGGEALARLLADAGPGARWFPRGSAEAEWIRDAAVEAFRRQTWNDAAQAELASWLRFRTAEAERLGDGLTPATMELGGLAGLIVRTFFDRKAVLGRSFREKGIDGVAAAAREGAGFLVLVSPGHGPRELLDAGRRWERVALGLADDGLAMHPMTQPLEEAPWRHELRAALALDGEPQGLLRIGKIGATRAPVSLRRPVSAFVS